MNVFRFLGDTSHQIAIILLILQLCRAKNARGISVKTQELRLIVFCTRYVDVFTTFYSLYNTGIKIFYVITTVGIVYSIKYADPIKSVYNFEQDAFPHWKYCVAPSIVLAFAVHLFGSGMSRFNLMELLWTFSIILEVVAILPQLMALRKYGLVENLTGKFVFLFGIYRFWYIINWIYRAHNVRNPQHHFLVYICGVLQVVLYLDFFDQYCRASLGHPLFCWRRRRKDDGNDDENDEDLVFELSRNDPRTQAPTKTQAEPLLVTLESGSASPARRRVPDES